jgi:hypothetical protein
MLEPVLPWSRERVIKHNHGAKRKLLERAYQDLQSNPLEQRDSKVRMFLKADKYEFGPDWKPKAPRCIQFRSKRYGLELSRFLHPIEADVYNNTLDASGTPVFAKARNSTQRAQDLAAKAAEFSHPVFVLLDQSNWDAHVNKTLLAYEHDLYLRKCRSTNLRGLLNKQLLNEGATKNGTTYSTTGTRMSGDCNTALGNCVINYGLLSTWTREAGVKACFYVDGDDSVVVVDRSQRERLEGLDAKAWFLKWGMESKVETTETFEHCEFCQCRPVWDGVGWRMVRNPKRVMVRSAWTVQPHPPAFYPRLVASVGRCELACNLGIPVLQALAYKMVEAGGKHHKVWRLINQYHRAKSEAWHPERALAGVREVTSESRASFAEAWGISPAEQLAMEASELSLGDTTEADWLLYLDRFAGDNRLAMRL